MNPLEYMLSEKKRLYDAICKNDEKVQKLTESLSLAEQDKGVLFSQLESCEEVISILKTQFPE